MEQNILDCGFPSSFSDVVLVNIIIFASPVFPNFFWISCVEKINMKIARAKKKQQISLKNEEK